MGKALYYTCAMMNRTLVKHVLDSEEEMPDVLIQGWVSTRRDSKAFSFLEVNDGSSVASLQVVADEGIPGYERIGEMATGSAVSIRGALVAGQGRLSLAEKGAYAGVSAFHRPFAPPHQPVWSRVPYAQ